MSNDEVKARIIEFVKNSVRKVGAREIANGLGLEHREAKKVITEMINEGALEFESFGGTTFIKLAAE